MVWILAPGRAINVAVLSIFFASRFMHHEPFRRGLIHAENVGGDLASVLNRRLLIGAFPWKFVGGEASICRIVAFES